MKQENSPFAYAGILLPIFFERLEFRLCLLLACYQQHHYKLEQEVASSDDEFSDDEFFVRLVSLPLLISTTQKKSCIRVGSAIHHSNNSILEKHKKYISRNTYPKGAAMGNG
jgi:hypothetical protein